MKMSIVTVLVPFLLILSVNGKYFRLGRSTGGSLGAPGECHDEELPKAQWFNQKLDHFSRTDLRTWKQRYYINDTFFDEKSGPVFLMIGGEGPADARWMVKGTWIDYAKDFRALCISLEHRFYGESHPTSDTSVKNLAYLTSEQALADLAYFISHINNHHLRKGAKWIVFGGSYPGSLAAWMRLKYPHLVHGAVSTSGPLLAQVDFDEYFQVVLAALKEKTGSDECTQQITEAHKQIVHMITANQSKIIEDSFRVCKPFSEATKDDMRNFYNSLADDFADVVQYNEDNRFSQDKKYRNVTINTVCQILTEPGSEVAYEKLAKFNSIILDKSNQTCLDYNYKNMIKDLRNTSWAAAGGRQWMYQTCNEFGFYQTSSGVQSVFGNEFPVDFFIQQCQDVFGTKFNKQYLSEAVQWTNTNYGALNIAASNVVFVHGTVDPWHALGITQRRGADPSVGVILIKGTAHCANMYPSRDSDPVELKNARLLIKQYIAKWLQ